MVLSIPNGLFGQDDVRETEVNVTQKTRYLSIPPAAWVTFNETDDVNINAYKIQMVASTIYCFAPVILPHGAVITNVIVYGNAGAAAETWELQRANFAGVDTTMAGANIGTADSTIINATVDNTAYSYCIETSSLDAGDAIHGVVITYTTDVIEV